MKKIFFILLCTGLVVNAQVRFTLEDCLGYAMGNGMVREQIVLSEQSAELDVDQARLDRLPSLSASAGETMSHQNGERRTVGGSLGASAGVTIFQGGALNNQIKQGKLLNEQAKTRTSQYDNTLAIDIMSGYYSVLGYRELAGYQQALIRAAEEQVRDGGERFKAGAMIESDYLMLQAQLEQNRNAAAQTTLDLQDAMRSLKALMSMPLEASLELAEADTTMVALPLEGEFVERAESVLPDRELLDYGVEIAQTSLNIARAGYYPTLSASGNLSTGHTGRYDVGRQLEDRFGQSAGVSLSVPIFNRLRTRTSVAQSRIALQQAELERAQGELDLRNTLLRSYSDAVSAAGDYNTLKVRENAYRRSVEAYRVQYAAGTIKPVDLLQQENDYINIMYQFVQSKYGFLLQRRILDVYMDEN